MRLTSFADYALRVLIFLAAEPGRRATVVEVAEAFDIKENHLRKVVQFLAHEGWIATVRGKGGGLTLAMPAAAIGVGDVLRRAEGRDVPAECFEHGGGACRIVRVCRLKGVLREALVAFHAVLDRYTLADLVTRPQAVQLALRRAA